MGKVKDEISTSKPAKPGKGRPGTAPKGLFAQFLANLLRIERYKPSHGQYARMYTAAGLGVIAAAGAWRVYDAFQDYTIYPRFGWPALFALVMAWVIFRIVEFPPFAEFLIATEGEMKKVSWTNKEDLLRATSVVLATVVLMALFLFVVDSLWTFILRMIGVLNFYGGGSFGSTG
jgi:preprotein translocase subunit SecE